MNKTALLTTVAALAGLLGGCSSGEDRPEGVTPDSGALFDGGQGPEFDAGPTPDLDAGEGPAVLTEQMKLTGGNAALFGTSVSIDGNRAIVAAPHHVPQELGAAQIFLETNGSWSLEETLLFTEGFDTGTGGQIQVAISGDTALLGFSRLNHALVFVRDGDTWTQEAVLVPDIGTDGDRFGASVSLDGDTAIIGDFTDSEVADTAGAAYVFVRSEGLWSKQAKLGAEDAANNDWFGYSVSLDGDRAVIGAPNDDDAGNFSGSAYVFSRTLGSWSQEQKLTASNASGNDSFGIAVTVHQDSILVGAPNRVSEHQLDGQAYHFARNQNAWTEEAILTASKAKGLGASVSMFGDLAVVGAREIRNSGLARAGAAYLFERDDSSWSQETILSATDLEAYDDFGRSVATNGETVLVGMPEDNGVDGSYLAGSVRVFVP